MSIGKAIKWKFARDFKPSSEEGETVHSILLCSVYSGYPSEGLEYYYKIGSYRDGEFYDEKGNRYSTDYWAVINEPHAWECDPPVNILETKKPEESNLTG